MKKWVMIVGIVVLILAIVAVAFSIKNPITGNGILDWFKKSSTTTKDDSSSTIETSAVSSGGSECSIDSDIYCKGLQNGDLVSFSTEAVTLTCQCMAELTSDEKGVLQPKFGSDGKRTCECSTQVVKESVY